MMEIKDVELSEYTSLRVGGKARMVVVRSEEELQDAVMYAKKEGLRIHVLGGGTNTYFSEHIEHFLIIKNEIKGINVQTARHSESINDSVLISCGAGEVWDDVVTYAVDNGLWGIENLSHIPGTVGGAPVQNIGAYGRELADVFVSLAALDIETLTVITMDSTMCQFGYRDSVFKHEQGRYIITSVTVKLIKSPSPVLTYKPLDALRDRVGVTLAEIREEVIRIRKVKLPDWKLYPNAGSFFKNPIVDEPRMISLKETYENIPFHQVEGGYKIPAAWLIEHVAEVKGLKIGDIGTWPVQPLVIVNYGRATSVEINHFASKIIKKIQEKTHIILENEVNFVE